MGGPVALLLLIVSAFVVNTILRSQGAYRLISGAELLLLGLGLGPMLLGVFDEELLSLVRPAMQVAVCWLGLLFGLRFHHARAARFGARPFLALTVETGATVATVALALRALVPHLAVLRLGGHPGLLVDTAAATLAVALSAGPLVVGLGLLAAPSTPALLEWARARLSARGPVTDALAALASRDSWIPLVGLALVCAFWSPVGTPAQLAASPLLAIGAQLLLALVVSAAFALLCGRDPDHETAWVVVIGLVLIAGGVAGLLALPGVSICFLFGLAVSAFTRDGSFVERVREATERPVVLLLLFMAGLSLTAVPAAWLAAALVLFLRLGTRIAIGPLLAPLLGGGADVGLGLLGAGAVTLAIAVQLELIAGGLPGQVVLWSAAALMVFGDLFGPQALRLVLHRRDEVGRAPGPDAPADGGAP